MPFRFPVPLPWKAITHVVLAARGTRESSPSSPSPGSLISPRASRSSPRRGETGRGNRAAAAGREGGRERGRAGRPAPGAQPASPGYVTRAQNKVRKAGSAFRGLASSPGSAGPASPRGRRLREAAAGESGRHRGPAGEGTARSVPSRTVLRRGGTRGRRALQSPGVPRQPALSQAALPARCPEAQGPAGLGWAGSGQPARNAPCARGERRPGRVAGTGATGCPRPSLSSPAGWQGAGRVAGSGGAAGSRLVQPPQRRLRRERPHGDGADSAVGPELAWGATAQSRACDCRDSSHTRNVSQR